MSLPLVHHLLFKLAPGCIPKSGIVREPSYDLQATSQLYKKQYMADILGFVSRMPPGKNMDDWFTIFRSGMWRLWWKLTKEGKKRYFEEFLDVLHQTK